MRVLAMAFLHTPYLLLLFSAHLWLRRESGITASLVHSHGSTFSLDPLSPRLRFSYQIELALEF